MAGAGDGSEAPAEPPAFRPDAELPAGDPGTEPGSAPGRPVVGRLAPSPTGELHLGNARTFLWAWLSARAASGLVRLRLEDLDAARARSEAAERQLDELAWLGLDWDGAVVRQSERRALYAEAFERLRPHLYPCGCTRAEVAAAQTAPHEGDAEPRYPGTCRERPPARVRAWRLRVEPGAVRFVDRLFGARAYDVAATIGDFVVARTPQEPAYQLAVVVDDLAQGVSEVVRGDDLLPSTARQLLLYRRLGAAAPGFGHVPLVLGPDGRRLAKRDASFTLGALRARGVGAERVVAALARWSGLPPLGRPAELIDAWRSTGGRSGWARASRERIVLTPERMAELVA